MLCDFGGTHATATAPTSPAACHRRADRRGRATPTPCCVDAQAAGGDGRRPSARRARTSTPRPARSSPTPATATQFIHRTGHGIGIEAHEDPYIVARQRARRCAPGHAFSIEPGIYSPVGGALRLEDIVVATDDGPDALNRVDHDLVVVDA